jgi:hybrid cluster-associated redox disulfide protein
MTQAQDGWILLGIKLATLERGIEVQFTQDMTILEALQTHPKSREVFLKFGMTCINCMGAQMESIAKGAHIHELDAEEIVKELNRLLEEDPAK